MDKAQRYALASFVVSFGLMGATKDLCSQRVNYYLRRWAEAEGVEPFTFYAERSWDIIAAANRKVLDLFSW